MPKFKSQTTNLQRSMQNNNLRITRKEIERLRATLTELLEVIDTFEGDEVQMPYTTAKLLAARVLAARAVLIEPF